MHEIVKNIFIVPGENKSLFPFCNCLYVKGRDMRLLVDAGMGPAGMKDCVKMGIDVLILTHCHYDHRSTIDQLPDVPVWSHEIEVPYIEDTGRFLAGVGLTRSGLDHTKFFTGLSSQRIRISKTLHDLERIDPGGLELEILHVPGHSPGLIALYAPGAGFLFTADVSLHSFGPFYGHDFADIDASIASIRRLKGVRASTVLTSNCGPYTDEFDRRFSEYEDVIYKRERLLLDMLNRPRRFDDFLGKGIIYANSPGMTQVMRWWERVHIEKHLRRFIQAGRIRQDGDFFIK